MVWSLPGNCDSDPFPREDEDSLEEFCCTELQLVSSIVCIFDSQCEENRNCGHKRSFAFCFVVVEECARIRLK